MKLRKVTDTGAFTRRELDVMALMAKGEPNKEIAAELSISCSAVHQHQYNIFRKLHVGNRTEASLKWTFMNNKATFPGLPAL